MHKDLYVRLICQEGQESEVVHCNLKKKTICSQHLEITAKKNQNIFLFQESNGSFHILGVKKSILKYFLFWTHLENTGICWNYDWESKIIYINFFLTTFMKVVNLHYSRISL